MTTSISSKAQKNRGWEYIQVELEIIDLFEKIYTKSYKFKIGAKTPKIRVNT